MEAALDAGALGSGISGAGPSMFALCRSLRSAVAAGTAMRETFAAASLDATVTISPGDAPGARRVA
jgi:homoserine kinase